MPFTAAQLENIANSVYDFAMDVGTVHKQSLQNKPLLRDMRAKEKTFPGGKEFLTGRAKGDYTTVIAGFEHDDQVSYLNPTNIKQFKYPWMLIHSGIQFTMHELLKAGISIVDSNNGKGETRHSENEKIILADILEDKLEDMIEGTDRGFNEMYWRDGTQDSKQVPGVTSFILNDPTSATVVGGIDQSANTWWRNRANVGFSQGSTPSDLTVVNLLQKEIRQLRRYGGKPTKAYCGSDWIEWLEKEVRSKGNFTMTGWDKKGSFDMSTADIEFKGIEMEYDPTLDDLGKAKYCYLLDTSAIHPMVIQGENMRKHNPSRPENKYVFYRAQTFAGGLVCKRRNSSGVYSIS